MSQENPWDWDLRVRERNISQGKLGEKELAKFLSALPDLTEQVESFSTPQPALDAPMDDEGDEPESTEG